LCHTLQSSCLVWCVTMLGMTYSLSVIGPLSLLVAWPLREMVSDWSHAEMIAEPIPTEMEDELSEARGSWLDVPVATEMEDEVSDARENWLDVSGWPLIVFVSCFGALLCACALRRSRVHRQPTVETRACPTPVSDKWVSRGECGAHPDAMAELLRRVQDAEADVVRMRPLVKENEALRAEFKQKNLEWQIELEGLRGQYQEGLLKLSEKDETIRQQEEQLKKQKQIHTDVKAARRSLQQPQFGKFDMDSEELFGGSFGSGGMPPPSLSNALPEFGHVTVQACDGSS